MMHRWIEDSGNRCAPSSRPIMLVISGALEVKQLVKRRTLHDVGRLPQEARGLNTQPFFILHVYSVCLGLTIDALRCARVERLLSNLQNCPLLVPIR